MPIRLVGYYAQKAYCSGTSISVEENPVSGTVKDGRDYFSNWMRNVICTNYSHDMHTMFVEQNILCRSAR